MLYGVERVGAVDIPAALNVHLGIRAVAIVDPVDWSLRAARFRWAEWLRRILEVDPLAGPRCRGRMRIIAVITEAAVSTRILAHRTRGRNSPQRSRGPPAATTALPHHGRSPPPVTPDPYPRGHWRAQLP